MIDEEVVVVVVVVADSTGCNGSASRLTRRTRLDLSTYRKHRETGGQETPTISYLSCLSFSFLFFFLSQRLSWLACRPPHGLAVLRENWFRVGDAGNERDKRQVEIERKVAGKIPSFTTID